MPTAVDLSQRVRRRIRDWPDLDATTASATSSSTSLSVADVDSTDGPVYYVGQRLEVGTETMIVRSVNASTNVVTVKRGAEGSTAASYASGATILFDPKFSFTEILDHLNDGLDNLWPWFYQTVVDESLTFASGTYEYTIPTVSGLSVPIPRLAELWIRPNGFLEWQPYRRFEIVRGATPKLMIRGELPSGAKLRLVGYAPFPHLTATDSTDGQLPYHGSNLAVDWAVGSLLYSGEAGRARVDTGMIDNREQANAQGGSMRIAREFERRFYQRAQEQRMPPMGVHKLVSM